MVRAAKRLASARADDRGDEQAGRGGQHPHPGLERVEPLHDLEEERDREEDPHQDQVLGEQHRQRRRAACGMPNRRRWTSGSSPRRLAAALPAREAGEDDAAGGDHERGQREAERLDRRVARPQPAPVARLQHAEHEQREPERRRGPSRPSRGAAGAPRASARGSAGCRAGSPIATTTSPTKTTRQLSSVVAQPPRIGPTAMPAPATPPSTP